VRTLPYTAYVSVLSYGIVFASSKALGLVGLLVLNEASNHALKFLGKRILPLSIVRRPVGAMDTGIYPSHRPKISSTSGMPSGHAQTSWFMATMLLNFIDLEGLPRFLSVVYIISVACLVSISRTKHAGVFCVHVDGEIKPPHTIEQVRFISWSLYAKIIKCILRFLLVVFLGFYSHPSRFPTLKKNG